MRICTSLISIAFVLLLSGCASVPMADKEHDRQAKIFAPKKNISNIYIYGFYASGVKHKVTIDGQVDIAITNGDFILLEVPPGNHAINIPDSKWGQHLMNDPRFGKEIDTKGGENYFLELDLKLESGNYLRQIDEEKGRKLVSESNLVLMEENVNQKIAVAFKQRKKQQQDAAAQRNFARPEKITAPRPIAGNSGKYRSPFTAAGTVALWAQNPVSGTDNGSDLAASVGGAVGQQLTQKALDFVPFGLGGMIGQKAGESAARAATKKNIEPELPGMDAVIASSDISFNSADKLAVYMYAKNSSHGQYARVLALAQRVYPELQDAYTSAIEKASQASDSKKGQSADERLDALKKLKEKGLITDADYLAKKNKIIDAM